MVVLLVARLTLGSDFIIFKHDTSLTTNRGLINYNGSLVSVETLFETYNNSALEANELEERFPLGSIGQYFNQNKLWQSLTTDDISETNNFFFSQETGYSIHL